MKTINNNSNDIDGIVLFSKHSGPTSFNSLNVIKKALNTNKVGHTGTLDSFAQGLLVVCSGKLTKLAGCITEFDKTYKAVIKFGQETDTLEKNGQIIKRGPLPSEEMLKKALEKFKGKLLQEPPAFSAIHIDGKRASDLSRKGLAVNIPARPIEIFYSNLLELKKNEDNKVEYCLIEFSVSKGTYIRSLARDIAYECGSFAHLIGLYRSKVGDFNIEDAAAYEYLPAFTIDSVLDNFEVNIDEEKIKNQIIEKKINFNKNIAKQCGFININLLDEDSLLNIKNGKKLQNKMFIENLFELPCNAIIAVFYQEKFVALLEKDNLGKIKYRFVM